MNLQQSRLFTAAFGAVIVSFLACSQPANGFQEQEQDSEAQTQQMINEARGQAALAAGKQAEADRRWREAIDAYETALSYLPDNVEAQQGLLRARAAWDDAPLLEGVADDLRVVLQRARVEFDAAMQQAQELLQQNDFNGAERLVLTAQIRLRQNRTLFSEREYAERNDRAENLLGQIDQARELEELIDRQRIEREARDAQAGEERAQGLERQRIINENLRRIRQLQLELKYDEALQVIDEILFIDELNPIALMLRDAMEASRLYREYQQIQRHREFGYGWESLQAQTAMIPPRQNMTGPGMRSVSGIMSYPEDWAHLSLRRTVDSGFAESPMNRRVTHVVSNTRMPVDFQGNRFEDVVRYVSNVTGENIYVDWKALELIGTTPSDPVSLQLKDVSVETVLNRVLEQVGNGYDKPQWAIEDGVVTISSEDALRENTVTVVYDIRDLLFEVPYFGNAPDVNLSSALDQGGNLGGGFGAGGGGGFGSGGGGGGAIFSDPGAEPSRLNREELVGQIIDIIQQNVDPNGWRDLGGDTSSLQELNGNLIVTTTLKQHRNLEGLLSQLREIRALQINVESRFLAVSTDWFEQIGVDLDLYFNTNNTLRQQQLATDPLGHLSDFFGPNGQLLDPLVLGSINNGDAFGISNGTNFGNAFGVPIDTNGNGIPDGIEYAIGPVGQPLRATQGFAPIGFVQDSLGLIDSIADLSGFGEAVMMANPALAVGIQFLDDVQVDLLIEATQADRRAIVMTSPRLTLFNGQRAWVAVTRQIAFISALIPITGDAAGAFQPIPGIINEGVVLDVEGVISADRRYVTMTVIVSLAELLDIREISVQGAVGGAGLAGGGAATFSATQELPEIAVSLVSTTVSVPDKGTALLGGTRLVDEIEVEAGVPVLSKIPFINRFFTNRLTSKTEETLLILIRPEIIIQQENEDLLFPGLSDTIGGAGAYLQ